MLSILALAAAASAEVDARTARLTALYDEVCLRAFPDDKAVAALMTSKNAQEMSQNEVKVTMRDDPARGWHLPGEQATVWLELPPFHACSVRWSAPATGDLAPYRALAERYEKAIGGFEPLRPFDADQGPIHVHAVGEARTLADQGAESLFFFVQHITDPQRRAAGATGLVLRFVHQLAPPPAAAK